MTNACSLTAERLRKALNGRPAAIAETGTAHGGDLQKGLDLVDAAADANADIVKLQVVFAREILPPQAGMVPLPGGPTPLYDVFRSLEQPPEFYAALAERAGKRNIGFLATPFGETSIKLLEEIGVQAWKVASPELNHEPLLRRLAATGKPLILSTGVSMPQDIDRALEVVRKAAAESAHPHGQAGRPAEKPAEKSADQPEVQQMHRLPQVILLHCLTSYPAPENEANLKTIPFMKERWHCPAGLSDHSLHPVLLPALAAALGAVLVEKHITLDRKAGGLDDPVALTPADFSRMTAALRRYAPAVLPLEAALKELMAEYGKERVQSCLGDGEKHLSPSETPNYGRTNRSLHAVGALKSGTVITTENSALLRTEKVLRPGIAPRHCHKAYGRRLRRDIAPGDGITWEDLE